MDNVIREDLVSLKFDVDNSELSKMQKELDELKKMLTGELGKGFDKAEDGAKKVTDSVEDIGKEAKKTTSFVDKMKAGLGKGLDGIKKKLDDVGKSASGAAFNGLKKIAGISFKALSVGIGAVATGLGVVLKQAVSSYGEYEQLVGGVETLFGTGGRNLQEYAKSLNKPVDQVKDKFDALMKGQNTVLKNANNAYKTAGLSANDYMNNVTSFSASLLTSVKGDTVKAAKVADKAMVAMADNANKMGTPMENIQTAYQGFAKQQYMLLDNLKLGKNVGTCQLEAA